MPPSRSGARGGTWSILVRVLALCGALTVVWTAFLAGYVHIDAPSTGPAAKALLIPNVAGTGDIRGLRVPQIHHRPGKAGGAAANSAPKAKKGGADKSRARPEKPDFILKKNIQPVATIEPNGDEYPFNFEILYGQGGASPSPLPEKYFLRNCECDDDWKEKKASGYTGSLCRCDRLPCASFVDPKYITDAPHQHVCSLLRPTGYSCTLECRNGEKGTAHWFAHGCGTGDQKPCPELLYSPSPTPTSHPPLPPRQEPPEVDWDPEEVMDLRGATCEMVDGIERCFTEDTQGREICPEYVTSEYLANPKRGTVPAECFPPYHKDWYCTIMCQEGNQYVRWWPQEVARCYGNDYGACPTRIPPVPKAKYTVQPWSLGEDGLRACHIAHNKGYRPSSPILGVTVGLLTHEPQSFRASMRSYEDNGFFPLVDEFLIYINGRRPDVEAVITPYMEKYPGKIKVLGTKENKGIAAGMVELTKAASNPVFLFLERDFWVIEPPACIEEELKAGVDLLNEGVADVIRYRSRRHAGRPNWAENFFRGHEWDAFVGRQPNLGCNIYYWIWDVEKSYPKYFWECGKGPQMLCSDSYYCNWTNNPQMWRLDWWDKEYVSQFNKWSRVSPWDDLESYMNWEPNSWNDRGFTVAQGEGFLKHIDSTKF